LPSFAGAFWPIIELRLKVPLAIRRELSFHSGTFIPKPTHLNKPSADIAPLGHQIETTEKKDLLLAVGACVSDVVGGGIAWSEIRTSVLRQDWRMSLQGGAVV